MLALTVTAAFGNHQRGDQITDQVEIKAIMASANAANVVQVNLPDPLAPTPSPA